MYKNIRYNSKYKNIGVSPSGKASDSDSDMRRFESYYPSQKINIYIELGVEMKKDYPPYTITDKMLNLATSIMEKIGEANYFESLNRFPELRKKTRIKSIHSSLAIENNQL